MSDCDLLIAGARTPDGPEPVDIAIADGRISQVGPALELTARERIDARGLLALPGGVDPHGHFNQPGPRAGSEGFATGSASLAAEGVTTTLEMPLNASPATTTVSAFVAKLAAVAGCPLHIVHASTGRGAALVAEAAARGADVTCEVTAHHLC